MTAPLKSFDENGIQYAWDATSLSNYMKCPRYYHFTNILGWRPMQTSVHLLFGGWYATALEHYYKHLADGRDKLSALREVVREALISTWNVEGEEGPWISPDDKKTRSNLIRTIVWYVDQYSLDPEGDAFDVVHLENGKPAVELSFAFEFSEGLLWCGHMDRVVTTPDGQYVMDQKTTGGAISAYYFKSYLLDPQMSGYTLAGKTLFNLPVKGVVIDAVQIAVGFSRFGRGFVTRSEAQLAEFYTSALHYIHRAQADTAAGEFQPNFASCNNYGGCAFREVCARSPEHRENFLRADFERKPRWDPLERR